MEQGNSEIQSLDQEISPLKAKIFNLIKEECKEKMEVGISKHMESTIHESVDEIMQILEADLNLR